jgi:hypothetical protein
LNTAGLPQWTADGVALSSICGRNVNKIAPDAAGGAIVVWETSSNVLAQRVNAGGAPQWTSDGVTLTSVSTVQNPTLVTDGTGGATVAWEDHRSGAYDIYAQHLSSAGAPQWTANGEALCSAGGDQVGPTIVSDAAGGAIVAWQDGRNAAGNSDIYAVRVRSTGFITAVNEVPRPAVAMSLGPIYPNPFNPVVSIQFGLELAGRVRLQIFDTSGRIVRTLFDDKSSAGYRTIRWDGTDEKGRGVASGIYFCRLSGAGGKITRRLALVR